MDASSQTTFNELSSSSTVTFPPSLLFFGIRLQQPPPPPPPKQQPIPDEGHPSSSVRPECERVPRLQQITISPYPPLSSEGELVGGGGSGDGLGGCGGGGGWGGESEPGERSDRSGERAIKTAEACQGENLKTLILTGISPPDPPFIPAETAPPAFISCKQLLQDEGCKSTRRIVTPVKSSQSDLLIALIRQTRERLSEAGM